MGVIERYEQKRKEQENSKNQVNYGVEYRYKSKNAKNVFDEISAKLSDLDAYSNKFLTSFNKRFYDSNGNFINEYRDDSADWLESVSNKRKHYNEESQYIKNRLEEYKDFVDPKKMQKIYETLDRNSKVYSEIFSFAKKDHYNWTEIFKSEEEYNEAVQAQKDYEALTTFDLEAGKAEIEGLRNSDEVVALRTERQTLWDNIRKYNRGVRTTYKTQEQVESAKKKLSQIDEKLSRIQSTIDEKQAYYNQAKYVQDGIALNNNAVNAEDFEEMSKYISTKAEGFWEKLTADDFGYKDTTYEYINNVNGIRDDYKRRHITYSADNPYDDDEFYLSIYDNMTADEIKVYNYYYAKEGKEKAEEYLKSIEKSINSREASRIFSGLEGDTFFELLFGVEAGLDQFASGMENLFNTKDNYIPPSATQMASGMVREDLANSSIPIWYNFKEGEWEDTILGSSLGQIGYDLTTTTSNMLPSILTSAAISYINPVAGQAVGAGLMGASASGNAYAEMLNLGYDKGQARLYSGLVGASEASLQYLLGGVGKLGGKVSSKVAVGIANNFDNAFARVAIKLGGNALGEFTEEYLQEVLNPVFKNFALGTNENVKLFSKEALYNGILGALSAGILEGGSTIVSDVKTTKLGKNVQKIDGGVERLKRLGTTFSADTVAYKIADQVTNETGAYKIGLLLQEVGGTLSEQNVSDIATELTNKGMDKATSKRIAKSYQAFLNEEMSLTDEQVKVLEELDPLADVLRKSIIGRNTSMYQRTREYSDLVQFATEAESNSKSSSISQDDVAKTSKINAPYSDEHYIESVVKEFEAMGMSAEQARAMAKTRSATSADSKSSPVTSNPTDSKFEASMDGKTINTKSGEAVEVVGVVASQNGDMMLKVKNGEGKVENVRAKDISFASQEEALIYSVVDDLGTNAAVAESLIKNFDPADGVSAQTYALGIKEAYTYGKAGIPMNEMSTKGYVMDLTEPQRLHAYKLGKNDAEVMFAKAQQKINANLTKPSANKKGKVYFDGDTTHLSDRQKVSLEVIQKLSEHLGTNFVVFESYENESGKRVYKDNNGSIKIAPNGYYDPSTGTIYIDLHAGNTGEGTILFTAAHELTHFIKQWSPAKFKILADFLMDQYGEKGISVDTLVKKQIAKAKEHGREIDYDTAYEEVIADSMETMLADGNVVEKLALLKAKDKGLVEKIKEYLTALVAKIKAAYKGLTPDSNEGRIVSEMVNVAERLETLFAEALADASDSYQKTDVRTQKNTTAEGGVSYSLRKGAENDVEKALKDKKYRNDVYLTESSPSIIASQKGVRNLPMLMKASHIRENVYTEQEAKNLGLKVDEHTHYHGLGKDLFLKIIDGLDDVKLAYRGTKNASDTSRRENYFLLISQYKDANGNTINVPVYINEKGQYNRVFMDTNKIATVFGRDNFFDYIQDKVKNGDLVRIKNRSTQAIERTALIAGGYSKNASNNNILNPNEKVKENVVKNSDRDTDAVSNRNLLVNSLESIAQNEIEKNKLKEYQSKISHLNAEEKKLAALRREIHDLSFSKGERDMAKLRSLKDEAVRTANRINIYDRQLLNLEATKPLQNVLNREKTLAKNRQKLKDAEVLKSYKEKSEAKVERLKAEYQEKRKGAVEKVRETRDKRDAVTKLQQIVLNTSKWISHPSKTDVKCPDILRGPYAEFLSNIDLSSKRLSEGGTPTNNDLKMSVAMNNLANAIERIRIDQDASTDDSKRENLDAGYLDLPQDYVQRLREMATEISDLMVDGDFVVNVMSSAQVKSLTKIIRVLNHAIKEMSTLYANQRFAKIEELGNNSVSFMEDLGDIKKSGVIKDFLLWDNALPYYAFKRFGDGGVSIFEELMDAQDKLAFLADEIFKFRDKTWSDKEAKAWSEDKHTINLPSGNVITLTTADAMSIYCLSRREQGLQHLLGGGVKVVGKKNRASKDADSRTNLTLEDIDAIHTSLTDRQRKVAEAMQEYMSTVCAEWGNEISMKRFLTREFTEKHYFPIESNSENLVAKDPRAQQSDLYRLLNISATKQLVKGANNEVIIRNIFDVFTNHTSDMARLNAFGMALLDYMKWVNYRESVTNNIGQVHTRGVRIAMNNAYGEKATSYIIDLIKDINGRSNDSGDHPFLMRLTKTAKTAMVGANLRVAMLQFTAYPRAAMVLSKKSLVLGLTKLPKIRMAQKYSGIALWKSFGFYDTNIARSIEDQIKGSVDVKQKLVELSLKGAEYADAITWGALWNACEYEVAATKKYKVFSDDFYRAVSQKLREVVYATQVVDSVLTRSQIMRKKSGLTQTATAFMSEPTVSTNILMNASFQFNVEKRKTGSSSLAWKKTHKIIGNAVAVYSVSAIITALAESFADAWRDDDDEEYKEKFLQAFTENLLSNINPISKIPYLADGADLVASLAGVGYFDSGSLYMEGADQLHTALSVWKELITEANGGAKTSKTLYNAIYNSVRAVSSVTGIPFSSAMREIVTLWNNTAGEVDSTLILSMYEPSNKVLGERLYKAIMEGDDVEAEKIKAQFADDKAMETALRKALRENDQRVADAAEALCDGDFKAYERLLDDIVDESGFEADIVKSAIRAEADKLSDASSNNGNEIDENKENDKAESIYEVSDINVAFEKGNTSLALEIMDDIVKCKTENYISKGETKKEAEKKAKSSVKSSMTSYWKPLYIEAYKSKDNEEVKRIKNILLKSNLYGNSNDVTKTSQDWIKSAKK
ncbi:MAG: hypothetical protein E7525_03340 [Ruminococcaceae bacterium]|nr:hypothetical protein [Oscillospiraceae bacterium]